MIFYSSIII